MNDTLFDDQVTPAPSVDPDKDYLTELVGEGKKFKTVQDLARSKMESDLYIKTLTQTQDQLREDYLRERGENTARQRLEELIDRLSKVQRQPDIDTDDTQQDVNRTPAIKPEDIESLVSQKLTQHEAARKEEENLKMVQAKLKDRYGDNSGSYLNSQVQALGYTREEANQLARQRPEVFLKLFGVTDQAQQDLFQAPPHSTRRIDSSTSGREKRSWSYYQQMRRDKPTLYYDPKTQVQMHKDREVLGRDFEDGDWNQLN